MLPSSPPLRVRRHPVTMPSPAVPSEFVQRTRERLGPEGDVWLRRLPALVAEYAQRWDFSPGSPFSLSFNYVIEVTCGDGSLAVLKLACPQHEFETELDALRLVDGQGASRLLAADSEERAMLLERVVPGTDLTALALEDDESATSIAATVMRRLWRPLPADHSFPTVDVWGRGFARHRAAHEGTAGQLPAARFEQAEKLFDELCGSAGEPVLLHGDLHHFNILAGAREPWLAIDPKGLAGEPAYETGALLRNPWGILTGMPNPRRLLRRRIDQLSEELSLDRDRIRGWAIAQAMLSAVWSAEDNDGDRAFAVACADLLAST